ncbi:chromophore lyase CpcT/CpeT [Geminocystis sp. GBBB08]|uniref:chromophore lyase CpcT/CpeT n=1 Tax=Geminocystis sp. GBBB08 TaxID=2604140 RepID=UPI0027E2ADDA|nr:chromophore lyase CpcT/CpeT [Geminocystis sp. GBBB08]MBL1208883.1 chorismate-binding protein [Geminocystis sp. GBBB08]
MGNENSELIITLAKWIAGEFSNKKQSFDHPQLFAHIHVFFRPLPWDFFQGIGFYSEQVYDYNMWTPYRQGVHRFVAQENQVYVENYSLNDPILYAGSGHNQDILKTITPKVIERRCNCSMVFTKKDDKFYGGVEGNKCLIKKGDVLTYLVSEVELTENTFISLDRGMDVNTHEQKWGSNHGALYFEKITDFSSELYF